MGGIGFSGTHFELRRAQSAEAVLAAGDVLGEALQNIKRLRAAHLPESHHLSPRASQRQCAAQPMHAIAYARRSQSRFASAEDDQLRTLPV
jgi:hypothetical protein